MSSSRPARIVVVADVAMVASLEPLLPDLEIELATTDTLTRRASELRPHVVLCAGDDAAAGLVQLKRLRAIRSDARTLFLTPEAAVRERLAALEAGVDEALPMPVAADELAGRIRLLLKRARPVRLSRLHGGGDMELDLDRRELLRDGQWVHLRPKEARLLELFARSPGRVMTRDHILSRVWGPDHTGDPRTVDVHVRWLRSKIEPDPRDPTWLLTVRGVGYRLEPAALTER